MKCRDCSFSKEDCVSSYSGIGLYWITFCNEMPHKPKLVDPDVDRDCENSVPLEVIKVGGQANAS